MASYILTGNGSASHLYFGELNSPAPHPVYWYYLDGRKVLRVTLPNLHSGSGSISTGFLNQIKNSLRLNMREFEDFEAIVRGRLNN